MCATMGTYCQFDIFLFFLRIANKISSFLQEEKYHLIIFIRAWLEHLTNARAAWDQTLIYTLLTNCCVLEGGPR